MHVLDTSEILSKSGGTYHALNTPFQTSDSIVESGARLDTTKRRQSGVVIKLLGEDTPVRIITVLE